LTRSPGIALGAGRGVGESMSSFSNPHYMYLFEMKSGKQSWRHPEDR
jgi:hypothetical protein